MGVQQQETSVAILMGIGEGERDMGLAALGLLIACDWPIPPHVYIIDDATPSRVGEKVALACRKAGVQALCHVMPKRQGYRGCIARTLAGLRLIVEDSEEYDLVVKTDPDCLFLRQDLGSELIGRTRGRCGMWGLLRRMRKRDRLLFLLDLLPFGFRRKHIEGVVQRRWSPSRTGPVWWSAIGRRALRNGFRFRFPQGGMYVLSGQTVRDLSRHGFLAAYDENRHGFITSEEDMMVAVLCQACQHPVFDLHDSAANWGNLRVSASERVDTLLSGEFFVAHPIKSSERDQKLRGLAAERALERAPAPLLTQFLEDVGWPDQQGK